MASLSDTRLHHARITGRNTSHIVKDCATDLYVSLETLDEYIKLREIKGLSPHWLYQINIYLVNYLEFVDYRIDKKTTIKYLLYLKNRYHNNTYHKIALQIRKFLKYMKVEWASDIEVPGDIFDTQVKRITTRDIEGVLRRFKGHRYELQVKALILLGASSGMRPSELYRLKLKDIDLENRSIFVERGKTGKTRSVFFNKGAKRALKDYVEFYNGKSELNYLFGQNHCANMFKDSGFQVKQLRKYFSQEWDRRNGSFAIKERLLGHSMKRVDFQHYSFLDEGDLKKVYDEVMS